MLFLLQEPPQTEPRKLGHPRQRLQVPGHLQGLLPSLWSPLFAWYATPQPQPRFDRAGSCAEPGPGQEGRPVDSVVQRCGLDLGVRGDGESTWHPRGFPLNTTGYEEFSQLILIFTLHSPNLVIY
uniref:Uncharacterized protein n=1 Tax=Rousettus aegyptiacus TaxID=9407 RepID=A0A7J8BSR3_ROUAE|nr:hypothetical protein HJG63_009610 [Rousettus aegyptiacus]